MSRIAVISVSVGIVLAGALKSLGEAVTVKDTWVDRATPMAGDLGRIGVRPVAGLAAPFLVRSVKSCRPGARGDRCGARR